MKNPDSCGPTEECPLVCANGRGVSGCGVYRLATGEGGRYAIRGTCSQC